MRREPCGAAMLRKGQMINGRYRIVRPIGKGGTGIVYLADDTKNGSSVSVKVMENGDSRRHAPVLELMRELSHPCLLQVTDVIEEGDRVFVVSEYAEGVSLERRILEEGAQPEREVIRVGLQLCDVLGYLHSRKPSVIYGDMKPANVIIRPDGRIALIDFGTLRVSGSEDTDDGRECLGTKGYAAPEQTEGKKTDERSDIYSLGTTLYHLATGHNPASPPYELRPVRELVPELSSTLESIINKCTAYDPVERFNGCEELAEALVRLSKRAAQLRKKQRSRLRLFTVSVILTVLMGVGALVFGLLEQSAREKLKENESADADSSVSAVTPVGSVVPSEGETLPDDSTEVTDIG